MFPFDIEEEDIDIEVDEEKEPSDYEIDFRTGKLTGRIVTGLDAIRQWVRIVLSTDRFYYQQYSWDMGSELSTLIGKGYGNDYIASEAKRMVEEALLVNGDINGISDFECLVDRDKLVLKFTIDTVYGRSEMNV